MTDYRRIFFAEMLAVFLILPSVPFVSLVFTPIVAAFCGFRYAFLYDVCSIPLYYVKFPSVIQGYFSFLYSIMPHGFVWIWALILVLFAIPACAVDAYVSLLVARKWIRPMIKKRVRRYI